MTTTYSVLGSTSDVTACDYCGRDDLRGTVILGALDADGNVEGVTHFGSDCAARATGRKATSIKSDARKRDAERRAVEFAARQAEQRREAAVKARETLAAIEAGTFTAADLRFAWRDLGMAAFVEYLRQTIARA